MNQSIQKEASRQNNQRLLRVHVVVGITFSLFMYISVFFGIFAIVLPYISAWEKPSKHYAMPDIRNINYSAMIDPVLADPDYPMINGVQIRLPGYRGNPSLTIYAPFTQRRIFNPNTNEEVKNEGKQSQLARFLNHMHYGRPLKDFGYWLFGFVAVAGLFLVVGGLVLVIVKKFNNTGKNAQSRFSKWHRKIFTWVFPPFIIITLTGALMNIGWTMSMPMTYVVSKGETFQEWKLTDPVLFPALPRIEKKNDIVPMLKMNELIKRAQEINPDINFNKIILINWKDSSAQAKLEGYNPYMPFLNGISNDPSVTLKGIDGSLISQNKVMDKHWSGLIYDSMMFLHKLFGVDTFTRFFVVFIMLISAFALGFGVLLWLEKKAKVFPKDIPVYQGMGKLSLAVMIGVIPATGLLFVLQWILPFDMQDRFLLQKGMFAVFWIATYTWACYKINSYETAKQFLKIAAVFFVISPFLHFYSSGFSPVRLWNENMGNILGVDIGLFIFALILFYVSVKLPSSREEAQKFWTRIL
ncbi:MAG: PepSY domain-containing protein [Campylobacteraceae bacterium]|nr:PepSY domain-containing protein [Campylobacteraceae bacterium]